jgi:tRNA G18 (ribose-2'-O)-methylase SpoU
MKVVELAAPDIVFVDLKVSRPLPLLLQLLQQVVDGKTPPRLIVVKSAQFLHEVRAAVKKPSASAAGPDHADTNRNEGGVAPTALWADLLHRKGEPIVKPVPVVATAEQHAAAVGGGGGDGGGAGGEGEGGVIVPVDFRMMCQTAWTTFFAERGYPAARVAAALLPQVPAETRRVRIKSVACKRMPWVVCVLERLVDIGNIAAVMRSAEAFGLGAVYLVGNPTDKVKPTRNQARVTVGGDKWLVVKWFSDTTACAAELKADGFHIAAAHCPADEAEEPRQGERAGNETPMVYRELMDLDWKQPTAILFGTEVQGVSAEALSVVDSCVYIGTTGFVQSLNVSVAAAVTFHAACAAVNAPGSTAREGKTTDASVAELSARALVGRGWTEADMLAAVAAAPE